MDKRMKNIKQNNMTCEKKKQKIIKQIRRYQKNTANKN